MKSGNLLSSFVLALLCSSPALAADKHDHGDLKPMHGGVIAEAGGLDMELVAKADGLTLYLADGHKPVASAAVKAKATVYAGGEKTPTAFEAAGDNRLVAKGRFKTGIGVRVAVAVTLPGKAEVRTTFNLK